MLLSIIVVLFVGTLYMSHLFYQLQRTKFHVDSTLRFIEVIVDSIDKLKSNRV